MTDLFLFLFLFLCRLRRLLFSPLQNAVIFSPSLSASCLPGSLGITITLDPDYATDPKPYPSLSNPAHRFIDPKPCPSLSRPRNTVLPELNLGPSYIMVPDDKTISGSAVLFTSLWQEMHKMEMVAICAVK
jgi:hypothetical protein